MNSIDRLLVNYVCQLRLPWAPNLAGKQRVWFAVYPPNEERRVRAHVQKFETTTLETQHGWSVVDLTNVFPDWLAGYEYREAIFKEPEFFSANTELEDLAVARVRAACTNEDIDASSVVAIVGLASLFDFIRVSNLIDRVEDTIRGRLLVLFPGEYMGNVYRFMDAREGFNYMAVPITTTESFISP